MTLPRVILHIGMSLDGRLDWVSVDQGLYYEIAARLAPDAMLSGSNTIRAADIPEEIPQEYQEMAAELEAQPDQNRQILAIVDSRGRIENWPAIRKQPWWKQAIALCSNATPEPYLAELERQGIESIVAGDNRVDLRAALTEMRSRFGVEIVRVDSGGILNGVLLRQGLVDGVSILIHPELVGGTTAQTLFVAPDLEEASQVVRLRLREVQRLSDDVVWLYYEVGPRE